MKRPSVGQQPWRRCRDWRVIQLVYHCDCARPGQLENLRLRLRHVDNGSGHAANHDHAARLLAAHEVTGNGGSEKIGSVDVDGPELAHAVDRVVDGLEVLGEARRGDEVVDLAVGLDDLGNAGLDGFGVGDIAVVSGDFGDAKDCQLTIL